MAFLLDVFYDGKDFELLKTPRINSNHTHEDVLSQALLLQNGKQ